MLFIFCVFVCFFAQEICRHPQGHRALPGGGLCEELTQLISLVDQLTPRHKRTRNDKNNRKGYRSHLKKGRIEVFETSKQPLNCISCGRQWIDFLLYGCAMEISRAESCRFSTWRNLATRHHAVKRDRKVRDVMQNLWTVKINTITSYNNIQHHYQRNIFDTKRSQSSSKLVKSQGFYCLAVGAFRRSSTSV